MKKQSPKKAWPEELKLIDVPSPQAFHERTMEALGTLRSATKLPVLPLPPREQQRFAEALRWAQHDLRLLRAAYPEATS